MMLRTIVIDDEPIPRRFLRTLVGDVDWLELVGDAADGATALAMIETHEPDLLFLDVRLPDLSGIEVLERCGQRPAVVFTTAHDQYAIRALQLGAVDYLLKPFGRQQFLDSIARVRQRLAEHVAPAAESPRPPAPRSRIYVRSGEVMLPVALESVERIEARGDCSILIESGRRHIAGIGLGEIEPLLDPQRFVRVHRSHIVNLDSIAALRPFDARRFQVVMKDGFQLTASRNGTRLLRELVV
jgi:two-component system LytT family response regulator